MDYMKYVLRTIYAESNKQWLLTDPGYFQIRLAEYPSYRSRKMKRWKTLL